jgi:uncharacterized protein (DUF983 family)
MIKGTKINSVLRGKCPVCQSAQVFQSSNPFKLRYLFKMPSNCSHCNNKYEIEPGYWFGAMYVSYGFTVAFSVAGFLLSYLLFPDADIWIHIGAVCFLNVVLSPISFRWSRLVWMNFFQKYDSTKATKS